MSKFFESLLESESPVIALDVDELEDALLHLRSLSRSTGRSFYAWNETTGLCSMKDSEITVPGCSKFIDALRYISNSLHYGIYIFSGFENQLTHNTQEALRKITKNTGQLKYTIILIGAGLKLPGILNDFIETISHKESDRPQLKLRDGRWLVT